MGIVERREREREEVRRKILEAGRELLATLGYDRLTMRRIAEAIEYSPTTLYHHFEDKDDLVKAICEEHFSQLLVAFAPEALPADPVERIRQLGLAYTAFGLAHPNHYRFMFMNLPEHPHEISEAAKRSYALLRDAVAQAIASGRFVKGDVDTTAQVLWASIHGAVALLITLRPEDFPLAPAAPDLARQVVDNGIRGFRKG